MPDEWKCIWGWWEYQYHHIVYVFSHKAKVSTDWKVDFKLVQNTKMKDVFTNHELLNQILFQSIQETCT